MKTSYLFRRKRPLFESAMSYIGRNTLSMVCALVLTAPALGYSLLLYLEVDTWQLNSSIPRAAAAATLLGAIVFPIVFYNIVRCLITNLFSRIGDRQVRANEAVRLNDTIAAHVKREASRQGMSSEQRYELAGSALVRSFDEAVTGNPKLLHGSDGLTTFRQRLSRRSTVLF